MAQKEKTAGDFLAIAISPVLIMALVGSLVFFLLEILYQGKHQGSLQWILFFFVFGAVLIARISMEAGIANRAAAYGSILGLSVWLALMRYVEYPPDAAVTSWAWAINLGLVAIIWWSAHRLTWDCTLIDDQVDASGAGLLEVAGLEKSAAAENIVAENTAEETVAKEQPASRKRKKEKDPPGLAGWWARYQRYRETEKKKPQAPGVWVVYFSLAALPLFGLGQAQIPVTESQRRAYSFWLMCIYVGSGLGLLLSTSFLGLRRYLRQRKLTMPAGITAAWLLLGVGLIATLMVLGAALPRPSAANPLWRWTGLDGKEQEGSSWGKIGEGQESKDGQKPSQKKAGPDDPEGAKKAGKEGRKTDSKSGEEKGGAKNQKGKGSSDNKTKDKQTDNDQEKSDEKKDERDREQAEKSEDRQTPDRPPPGSSSLDEFFAFLGKVLKWLVIAAVVILVAFFVVRALLQFLANFTDWARNLLAFWNSLFAWWQRRPRDAEESSSSDTALPPRPFASFHDPFLSGAAARMSGAALVRYSFEALEAWARERDCARGTGETPREFAQRAGDEAPALESFAIRLADLYAALAYGRANLTGDGRESLRKFWLMLAEVKVRPLSAALAE